MEPIVVERPSSQELPNNQSQRWDNDIVFSSVTPLQHPSESSNCNGQTSWSKAHIPSSGFDCDNEKGGGAQIALCHYSLQGKFAHEEFCKRQHSETDSGEHLQQGTMTASRDPDFSDQRTHDTLRTSQPQDEADKGSGPRTRSVSRECDGRSFCRNFLRDRCFHGAACPDLHAEYTSYIMPGYDWCVKLHQEILANSENPAGDVSNPEIAGSDPPSSCGKTCASPADADASAFNKDINSSVGISFSHERSEKSDEVKQALALSSKKKRKRCSMHSSGSLDSDTAVLNKNTEGECAEEATLSSRRKLLVLDVNGILVDIVPCHRRSKKRAVPMVSGKAVYKRPCCEDFLDFCFEHFNVGIWSSRKRKNVDKVVDLLLGEKKNRLLFCWDASYCTDTGKKTLENKGKPLVLKELEKLWQKHRPDVPWDKGYYNETNTVLLDDSPYKALFNPPYTAIFPSPFSIKKGSDNSLGRKGELRKYLMRLAEANDVQKFIRENPFGQKPITESSEHWAFYKKIINPPPCAPEKKKQKKQVIIIYK